MTHYCVYCGNKIEDSTSIHGQANVAVTAQYCEDCGKHHKECKCEVKKWASKLKKLE